MRWRILACLLLVVSASAQSYCRVWNWAEQGNQTISVLGYQSSIATPVQASYPNATITVYVSGTQSIASAVYVSGGSFTGAAGTTVTVTFVGVPLSAGSGAIGTLTLTGTNTVAPGTPITINAGGSGFLNPSVSGVLSNGTATASGTIILTSVTTGTLATIYSDGLGNPQTNPFTLTAGSTASGNGYSFFYAICGTHVDVQISGTGVPVPFTLGDIIAGGGSGGGGNVTGGNCTATASPFTPQTPGITLAAGVSATVSLTPVPAGVNGTDVGHWLAINGGVGTPEPVLITGGSAVSGSSTGTITFTPAYIHAGSWTIGPANAGIAEAQAQLPVAAGLSYGTICVPEGQFTLYGPFYKLPGAVYVQGAGEDATTFNVATTLPLTAVGAFAAPNDDAAYTAGVKSGGFSNFTITFTQPNSSSIGAYTQWPAGVYGYKQNRMLIQNVKVIAAWNAFQFNGYNGPEIYNCKASYFNHGIDIDSMVDTTSVFRWEGWPFGLTTTQFNVMFENPSTYGLYIGRADDFNCVQCAMDGNAGYLYYSSGGTNLIPGGAWATITNSDLDSGGLIIHGAARVNVSDSQIGGVTGGSLTSRSCVAIQGDVTGGVSEVTLANNWMGYGSEANTASCVDIDFSYTYEITDQGLATIKLIGNRFYIGGQNLTTPNDVTVVNVHSAYNGACTDSNPCVGSALIENSMFDNTLAVNFTLTNPIIKCTGFNKCLVMGNRINDKYDPTGNNPGTFFAADTDSGHIVTNNMAPWWGITYPANVAVSAFGNNTAITDPVPISSTTSLQATSYIEPTGTMFHLTGGGTALHALNYVNNGRDSTTAFYQFTAICDNGLTWNTGGSLGFAANGSVGAGGMVTFTWDPGTSLWYASQ